MIRKRNENTIMKLPYAAIVLIPTLIAMLMFYISHTLFAAPEVLFGTARLTIAVLCVVAGVILLVPA